MNKAVVGLIIGVIIIAGALYYYQSTAQAGQAEQVNEQTLSSLEQDLNALSSVEEINSSELVPAEDFS